MIHPKEERTLVLIKPDGVKRGLIGEIMHRFEMRSLKIVALKMVHASKEDIAKHYPSTDENWLKTIGGKTLENYQQYGKDPVAECGTADPLEIGKKVYAWLEEFMASGAIVAMVVQGLHAVDMVRKICGATLPSKADMGTIRGDYSTDSPTLANMEKRPIRNIVHASGNLEEAAHEVSLWFTDKEIHGYTRSEEDMQF